LENKRFDNKFKYVLDVSQIDKMDKTYLPSLLVQPFVENAIVHGLSAQTESLLKVIFRKKTTSLFIHVIDNGIGRKAANLKKRKKGTGVSTALKIMQERQEYSQESKKFHFNYKILNKYPNRENVGTHVVLQVLDLNQKDVY